ncbi:MAG: DUF5777 family beta-barrel protein [Bacteroidota bacterium]
MKRYQFPFLFLSILPFLLPAQDYTFRTFKDRRIINAHSVEVLPKRKLDIRIGHRFGDMFGESGGWPTFYGLENATDVMLGAEYGLTNRINIGLYRSKGGGALSQLVNGLVKYNIVRQREGQVGSFSVTALGVLTVSTMQKSDNPEALNFFDKTSHRMAYTVQIMLGKKLSERFSFQLTPGFTHRNIVAFGDTNDTYTIGGAARFQLTKVIGVLVDMTLPLNGEQSPITRSQESPYTIPLGLGIEFDTGGHIFQVNFTNARGMIESDYIPNTTSDWLEGEFRLGFTISRLFNIR